VAFRVDAKGSVPTGDVTVSSDGGESCTAAVTAGACTISFTSAGTFALTAVYAGDTTFGPSSSHPVAHEVDDAEPPPGPGENGQVPAQRVVAP